MSIIKKIKNKLLNKTSSKTNVIYLYRVNLRFPKNILIAANSCEDALIKVIKKYGLKNIEFGLLVSVKCLATDEEKIILPALFLFKNKFISQEEYEKLEKEMEDLV